MDARVELGAVNAPSWQDAPAGYPQYTRLLSTDQRFTIFRGFRALRFRVGLTLQGRVAQLESRLHKMDESETNLDFLRCSYDSNRERKDLFGEILSAFNDYDKFLKQSWQNCFSRRRPAQRDVESLINYNNNDGSISYDEVLYLSATDDLLYFGNEEDPVSETIQSFIEDIVTWFKENVMHRLNSPFSRGRSVQNNSHYHFAGPGIQIASGFAKAIFFLSAIIAPPLILANVSSMVARLATISIFTGVLIVLLLWMKKDSGSTDVFMMSATYATVLMMFMSSSTGLIS